jgi:2-amino-4-hydroxy-6-hydroxymethyldihydropteridine diphosphokinase
MPKSVYLLLGSNQGEREANLQNARKAIEKNIGKIAQKSHHYETQSWGKTDEDDHLNQALEVQTVLSPREVLRKLQQIETEMGRIKTQKYGSRIIDIDILMYENLVVNEPDLVIPHPELPNRNFALIPLMEIAGETEHPTLGLPIEEIYLACEDELEVFMLD